MKVFVVDFDPVWPVGCGLVIAAKNKTQAEYIARKTIVHTDKINSITEVGLDKPGVIFYQSGEY